MTLMGMQLRRFTETEKQSAGFGYGNEDTPASSLKEFPLDNIKNSTQNPDSRHKEATEGKNERLE